MSFSSYSYLGELPLENILDPPSFFVKDEEKQETGFYLCPVNELLRISIDLKSQRQKNRDISKFGPNGELSTLKPQDIQHFISKNYRVRTKSYDKPESTKQSKIEMSTTRFLEEQDIKHTLISQPLNNTT